ncbi:MAG TPA: S49 family peptidase, partial [Methyloceanibacter sp.]|nr:S49 family peptidase [Methyloceanibacter sp.]
ITGSVGVIFQWADVSELMRTLGVKVEEVKSGPLKAVPNPFEPTDEKGRALAAEMVQEAKVWFVDLVGKRRNLQPASVPGLTDGRVYSGRQALALKLVDEIGDERAAKRWLQQEREITPGLSVVEWKPRTESGGILGWLFGSIASSLGIAVGNFASLFGQVSEGLRLDGLVSLWHPAGS